MASMKIVEYSQKDISSFFKPRVAESNKSDYGKFLVIGGSVGMTGALKLCVDACYRSGAGLVYYTAPKNDMLVYDLLSVEGITVAIEDIETGMHLDKKDCICIGCGLSYDSLSFRLLEETLNRSTCHIVCDATALRLLASKKELLKQHGHRMTILPHPGEMSALTGMSIEAIQKDRINIANSFYEAYGCVTVLKGHKTVVAGESGVFINSTGNAGMATAGSGDVLAGMTTAYSIMTDNAFTNACVATYMHGYAGDLAMEEYGRISMIASDIIKYIPKAHKEVAGGKA